MKPSLTHLTLYSIILLANHLAAPTTLMLPY